MKTLFEPHQLPISEFQRLGLVFENHIQLDPVDLNALLLGRRTGLITLRNLEANGLKLEKIDLKLSLETNREGKLSLSLHPIFRSPQQHPLLQGYDADPLMDGTAANIHKVYNKNSRQEYEAVIEYDPQTRSFIAYDPLQVAAPIAINGITLTEPQDYQFRRGLLVDLGDGTKFQHRASEPLGIVANRSELILTFEDPGPFQHVYMHGIRNIPLTRQPQLFPDTLAFRMAMQENDPPRYTAFASGEISSAENQPLPSRKR
ncbi:hypothetical protein CA265_20780 [Sphingobacteriaceae bacterium GW460-11-11-14-LB5]|nr:hypothetical protein CA265_20780 [Sphingobacteriaceae bacterium GW460-11-11-14-LB5]